jgi:hypothetical protein
MHCRSAILCGVTYAILVSYVLQSTPFPESSYRLLPSSLSDKFRSETAAFPEIQAHVHFLIIVSRQYGITEA